MGEAHDSPLARSQECSSSSSSSSSKAPTTSSVGVSPLMSGRSSRAGAGAGSLAAGGGSLAAAASTCSQCSEVAIWLVDVLSTSLLFSRSAAFFLIAASSSFIIC